ncbi:cysteine desulfurase [Mycobacterium sp. KBS0706]|uniref:cysteine desulfurase family protein n=1 Tax=Mycobacterium sp. KBS0706 TaxID=2578109 RepID=UPI00110F7E5D|nr:cysteine desulfurase family protein [Mycobacterium sp. KBS0706]TSD90798.1 cysteine desulfurase [Mycobacterium sp. KBS0706]
MTAPLYLDHLASTPLDPEVLDAMRAWLDPAAVGNPHAARHRPGWRAAEAIEAARAEVAALVGARPGEILFTGGATEANNLALLGGTPEGWPVIASATEHPSVLACLPELAARGHRTATLPVGPDGTADLAALETLLAGRPALVSLMAANNEIGTIQPLAEAARICVTAGALLHTDAVQILSTGAVDVRALDLAFLSLSGHKLYGPMGIGALFVREGAALRPLLLGGGQQQGRRAGTLPTALCVGLGAACSIARQRRSADAQRLAALRERLFQALQQALPGLRRNGSADHGLPGCLNVSVPGLDAADLLLDLPELALSTGSACSTGSPEPSHVLRAIGLAPEEAHGSLRFGLGRGTTEADIDRAATRLVAAIRARGRG